jgi:hypothetical protein
MGVKHDLPVLSVCNDAFITLNSVVSSDSLMYHIFLNLIGTQFLAIF